ncbi:CHAT domain-containing protein [Frigoribacterium sp. PhB118]|uniref:CHAT domain-containing protein n=1 Tax=Frigoribacterium sp. PhB118 TaxID=2485175 RepID=UPI000F998279|nr:CHAT domain-containing protein [Frigoribacterium sp. PhB118]ROS53896.1 CHAT domain-containing protein [Frigoribacterium sp. PhB118]
MQPHEPRPGEVSFRPILYVVAAPLSGGLDDGEPSYLTDTLPGGTFDEDLLPVLPGIWYAMHLPKNRFETLDLPLRGVQAGDSRYSKSHNIALVPDQLLRDVDFLRRLIGPHEPALIIATDRAMADAALAAASLDFSLPPVSVDEIDQALLDKHWGSLADRWAAEWPADAPALDRTPLRWSWPIDGDGSLLPLQRLRRLMGSPLTVLPNPKTPFGSAHELRFTWLRLNALVQMELDGISPDENAQRLPEEMRRQAALTRTPLTLGVSGTAPRYIRFASGVDGVSQSTFRDDYPDVRAILVGHAAVREDSTGVVLEDALTPAMFVALANLERGWAENASAAGVRKLLKRLDESAAPLWTEDLVQAIKVASRLDIYSNFPIGLLTLPGDQEPLAGRLPISYSPLNPLTRALQFELSPQHPTDLSSGLTILIAECIPGADPVGQISRKGWSTVEAEMSTQPHVHVTVAETLTPTAVRDAIERVHPDVLVLSAHGFHDTSLNVAGLIIGDTPSMGDDFGELPPLVILSACHTTPRGGGVVSVGDLLIRAGAKAVVTALVPVLVQHNSALTSRFLRYLALAIGEDASEPATNVLDVWHRAQSSNVVIDLTYGNERLRAWSFRRDGTKPSPIEQFMTSDHGVPLRVGHLYEDAEQRLIEIAKATGDDAKVRNWLRVPGYLPESLMYTLLGHPASLLLRT